MTAPAWDVLVVGGGPVGLAAGTLLARAAGAGPGLRVALLQSADPPDDGRVLALSRASEHILCAAGAWEGMRSSAFAYERMRVWYGGVAADGDEVLQFDAAEVGEPNLGYIVNAHTLSAALRDAFQAAGGEVLNGELQGLQSAAAGVAVRTLGAPISARLVVGADGARSAVRTAMGIAARTSSYQQSAIVARLIPALPHRNTAWQRFIDGGTLALLPLADGSVSIVWSLVQAQAQMLLSAPVAQFEARLLEHSDGVLGALQLAGERLTFPLHRLSAARYIGSRCALVGDAAHVVHPLAGQGVNLGLLDAAALAQLCVRARRSGEELGAQRTLRDYERWRKGENQLMEFTIDAFNRVLAQGVGPLSVMARRALALTNRSALLKRFFIGHALGQAPDLTAWESDPASPHR